MEFATNVIRPNVSSKNQVSSSLWFCGSLLIKRIGQSKGENQKVQETKHFGSNGGNAKKKKERNPQFLEKRPTNKDVSYVSKTNPEETQF